MDRLKRNRIITIILLSFFIVAIIAISGCGGGSGQESSPTTTTTPSSNPSSTPNATLRVSVSNISKFRTKGTETLAIGVMKTDKDGAPAAEPLEESTIPEGDSYEKEFIVEANQTYSVSAGIIDSQVTAAAQASCSTPPGGISNISISLSNSNTSFSSEIPTDTMGANVSNPLNAKDIGVWYWIWWCDWVQETYDYGGDRDYRVWWKDGIREPKTNSISIMIYPKTLDAWWALWYYYVYRGKGMVCGGYFDSDYLHFFFVVGGGVTKWLFFNSPNYMGKCFYVKYMYR